MVDRSVVRGAVFGPLLSVFLIILGFGAIVHLAQEYPITVGLSIGLSPIVFMAIGLLKGGSLR